MAKMCTDIEQSRRLIELGLDVATADMIINSTNPYAIYVELKDKPFDDEHDPAWSLAALLDLMPSYIEDSRYKFVRSGKPVTFYLSSDCKGVICYGHLFNECHVSDNTPRNLYGISSVSLLDAAFETVVWLLENGYLKEGGVSDGDGKVSV